MSDDGFELAFRLAVDVVSFIPAVLITYFYIRPEVLATAPETWPPIAVLLTVLIGGYIAWKLLAFVVAGALCLLLIVVLAML